MKPSDSRILILEDDQNLRETLQEILQLKGYQTLTCSSAQQALAYAHEQILSVVLIDLKLEDASGLEVLKSMHEYAPDTQCIITTGFATTQTAIDAINLGAYSYVQKPYDIDQLLLTIERALEKIQTSRALSESEDRYLQLYQSAFDGIITADLEGHIRDFNPAFRKIVGYEANELTGKSLLDMTPPEYHQNEKKIIAKARERGYSEIFEKEYFRKDGSRAPVEIISFISRDNSGQPTSVWGFVRDISERKSSEEKLRRQLLEVTALHDVSSAGTQANTVDELINIITESLGRTLYSDTFGVNVYDKERHRIVPHKYYHRGDFSERGIEISADLGITGRAIKTRKPQIVGDVLKDKDYYPSWSESRSELAIPILVGDDVFGVINAESQEADFFTKEDLNLLSSIARQMAIAIERIQLSEQQTQRNKELAALYETSLAVSSILDTQDLYQRVYQQINAAFQPDAFILATFNAFDESITITYAVEEGQRVEDIINQRYTAEDSGLMGWLMRNRQSLRFGDMTKEQLPVESPQEGKPIRSWLGVPLIAKGKVVGAISVQCFEEEVYSDSHCLLLESMAGQLAIALDNAALLEQSQNQIERLAALHDIDMAINSSLDLRVIMNILLDQVIDRLGVDAAAILLLDARTNTLRFTSSRGFKTHDIENYSLDMQGASFGHTAIERHLVQALDLDREANTLGYTDIMQNESFESFFSVPLIAKGMMMGVLDVFHRTPLNPDQDWFNFLETLAGQAALAIDNSALLDNLNQTNTELTEAYDTTLEGWSRALDMRDRETEGHTRRVAEMTIKIARELNIPEEEIVHIRRGALLHDIGKMGIPDSILLKPGPLSEKEWEIMRTHATRAYELLNPISYLRAALDIPLHHHEKFDGSGYPQGLKGEDIPLAARVFAVVDVWDALTSDRPYREAWTAKKSLDYIREQSGKHFDPNVVDVFLNLIQGEMLNGSASQKI